LKKDTHALLNPTQSQICRPESETDVFGTHTVQILLGRTELVGVAVDQAPTNKVVLAPWGMGGDKNINIV
jgi:hypothetical protein